MARPVTFLYDIVCPYSYMESRAVEAAEDARAVIVDWVPFELRPAPRPLLEVRGDHLRVDWTRNVYRRAVALGIEIHLPRFQPRSTLPLTACLWADEHGAGRAFRHALYEAFFCDGEDVATDRELARAAASAGLDPDGAIAAAYEAARIERVGELRSWALSAGIRGVPSLLTADGASHWGMGGVERLLAGQPLVPRSA